MKEQQDKLYNIIYKYYIKPSLDIKMMNCKSCTDCDYCIDCENCEDCHFCIGLKNCKSCYKMIYCENCTNCMFCIKCDNCIISYICYNCTKCEYILSCYNCENISNQFNSYDQQSNVLQQSILKTLQQKETVQLNGTDYKITIKDKDVYLNLDRYDKMYFIKKILPLIKGFEFTKNLNLQWNSDQTNIENLDLYYILKSCGIEDIKFDWKVFLNFAPNNFTVYSQLLKLLIFEIMWFISEYELCDIQWQFRTFELYVDEVKDAYKNFEKRQQILKENLRQQQI